MIPGELLPDDDPIVLNAGRPALICTGPSAKRTSPGIMGSARAR